VRGEEGRGKRGERCVLGSGGSRRRVEGIEAVREGVEEVRSEERMSKR